MAAEFGARPLKIRELSMKAGRIENLVEKPFSVASNVSIGAKATANIREPSSSSLVRFQPLHHSDEKALQKGIHQKRGSSEFSSSACLLSLNLERLKAFWFASIYSRLLLDAFFILFLSPLSYHHRVSCGLSVRLDKPLLSASANNPKRSALASIRGLLISLTRPR